MIGLRGLTLLLSSILAKLFGLVDIPEKKRLNAVVVGSLVGMSV